MSELIPAISAVRASVAAILQLHTNAPERDDKGNLLPGKVLGTLGGSAFCVGADKYLITAQHVLNGGKTRDPDDKFYALIVPGNGHRAFHIPIVSFPLERKDLDMAVLELGPMPAPDFHIPALPVSFDQQDDGMRVVTVGFPSPTIAKFSLDAQGNYSGGEFFLKSHANEGIVSAHYLMGESLFYELNVGWHHGESGGPVVALTDPPSVFTLMQHYRNIQAPHGTVAGPHRGIALSMIRKELGELGLP